MLEIPESFTISNQLNDTIRNKIIKNVYANSAPHKFAFYFGDPESYGKLLKGKKISDIKAIAGQVEIAAEDTRILLGDGVNVRYYNANEKLPLKHQLHIEFEDFSSIICTVQMYGGRDTEKDLFGNYGGYKTLMSNKAFKYPCPICGGTIIRQAYLGGNVYYCPNCQPVKGS